MASTMAPAVAASVVTAVPPGASVATSMTAVMTGVVSMMTAVISVMTTVASVAGR